MAVDPGTTRRVDLNCDVGESWGRWELGADSALLPLVTSANLACGFHAGDPSTIRRTCALAVRVGARIGAQVSYPDLLGFGRRFLDISRSELADAVLYQIAAVDGVARAEGSCVSYVKAHGALYHTIAHHADQAAAVIDGVSAYDPRLPILGLRSSVLWELGQRSGARMVSEGFADRAYRPDGTLVPRSAAGAVLTDPAAIAAQARDIVRDRRVRAAGAGYVPLEVESLCLHGDNPVATDAARLIRIELDAAGVEVGPFANPTRS